MSGKQEAKKKKTTTFFSLIFHFSLSVYRTIIKVRGQDDGSRPMAAQVLA